MILDGKICLFSFYFMIINLTATQLDLDGDKESMEPNELQWEQSSEGIRAHGGEGCSPEL